MIFKELFWTLAAGTTLSALGFLALGLGVPAGHELKSVAAQTVLFGLAQSVPAILLWIGIALKKYEAFKSLPAESYIFPVHGWATQLIWLEILACSLASLAYSVVVFRRYEWQLFFM